MALTQLNTNGVGSSPASSEASSETGRTAVERNYACEQDVTATKHATILDIDPDARAPKDGMTFRKPTMEDLLRQGPAQIMSEIKDHTARIRWVHLRSNCMSWIEGLMDKVCEENHIQMLDNPSERSLTPTKLNPLLRKDLWSHLFHGKASDQIQTRFMGPTCTPFSINMDDEQSDSNGGSTRGPRDNLVLYLPYLNWESVQSWEGRQQLIQNIAEGRPGKVQPDTELIQTYLHHQSAPLHDRRTLHQAYYHDCGMTRSLPEYNQVMHQFTAQISSEEEAKLIVVDQLWLWIIRSRGVTGEEGEEKLAPDLVITAFPGRFNGLHDSSDIYHGIIEHLERGVEPPIRTANDLASVVIEHCTGVFFQRQLQTDKWFLEFFASAIGIIRDQQKAAFVKFCEASHQLEELQAKKATLVEVSRQLEDPAFSISAETSLFRQIKDVIDELGCIDYILARQEDVVRSLTRTQKSRSLKTVSEIVTERRRSWTGIADTALSAYKQIQAQMDLKQKQSSLAEARTSRYQIEDSARHGRIMLLFTVVTIIFLPMSFMATWFGMNLRGTENSGQLTLGIIAAIIFPISIVIVAVALAFAFSQRLRDWLALWLAKVADGILGLFGKRIERRRSGFEMRLRRRLTGIGLDEEMV